MKLTALEIKQQQFEKSLRGYDVGEVKAFLNMVSTEWEYMMAKNRELIREIDQLKDKLRHYERVEQALHETLQTAKETADQRIAGAKKEARNRIEKAEMDAEAIVGKARQQRHEIRQNIRTLLDRREEIIRGMRSYLDLAQESLHGFSKDDSGIFTLTRDEEADADAKAANAPAPKPRKDSSESDDNTTAFVIPDADDLDDFLDKIE
ncbi:MAG: DivIVA domain-containing protein [Bacteroidetes bacterium]|nr:DivIVA domain-containing protein [Bacteroidota bacterium]MCH8523175.1 DivIVA domain-containing protein [Balneolales bacterium]